MRFILADIVVFKQDSENRLWEVVALPAEGNRKVQIRQLGETYTEDAYDHLITLAEPILQFFRYEHLPEALQETSRPFCALASDMIISLPRSPERTVALRKLLEAKDAAVRASIYEA